MKKPILYAIKVVDYIKPNRISPPVYVHCYPRVDWDNMVLHGAFGPTIFDLDGWFVYTCNKTWQYVSSRMGQYLGLS